MKQVWKPGTMIYPLPAVLVSCGDNEISNFLTVAWTGTICTDPAMCYISVRPERYSHELIKRHIGIHHKPHHRRNGQGNRLGRCKVRQGFQ